MGDLYGSGSISISDVTMLIEMLLTGQTESPTYAFADVNLDGVISIKDVTDLIARMLSGE